MKSESPMRWKSQKERIKQLKTCNVGQFKVKGVADNYSIKPTFGPCITELKVHGVFCMHSAVRFQLWKRIWIVTQMAMYILQVINMPIVRDWNWWEHLESIRQLRYISKHQYTMIRTLSRANNKIRILSEDFASLRIFLCRFTLSCRFGHWPESRESVIRMPINEQGSWNRLWRNQPLWRARSVLH